MIGRLEPVPLALARDPSPILLACRASSRDQVTPPDRDLLWARSRTLLSSAADQHGVEAAKGETVAQQPLGVGRRGRE